MSDRERTAALIVDLATSIEAVLDEWDDIEATQLVADVLDDLLAERWSVSIELEPRR